MIFYYFSYISFYQSQIGSNPDSEKLVIQEYSLHIKNIELNNYPVALFIGTSLFLQNSI